MIRKFTDQQEVLKLDKQKVEYLNREEMILSAQ